MGYQSWTTIKELPIQGERIIIELTGSEQGFIPNGLLTYKASSVSGDYHSNMNAENNSV